MIEDNFFLFQQPKHFGGVANLNMEDYNTVLGIPTFYSSQLVSIAGKRRFVYCTELSERESFSSLFWSIPMDTWSWILLGITCLSITILLRGQWFQVYSILMRQSCTILNKNRTLIIFILATIIFTYGYEGIISSLVIVPPPIKVFNTMKELLDNGYRIVGHYETNPDYI